MKEVEIYTKEFEDCFDFLTVNLIVPSFVLFKKNQDYYCGKLRMCDIEFSNKFFISSDDCGFVFVGVIMGFGVKIVRQWDY